MVVQLAIFFQQVLIYYYFTPPNFRFWGSIVVRLIPEHPQLCLAVLMVFKFLLYSSMNPPITGVYS